MIESVLDCKTKDGSKYFKVKWLNFPESESTWEPETSIPKFIQLFYTEKNNLGKPLPNPKLKRSKVAGSETYHYLSWGTEGDGQWYHEDFFTLLGEDGEISSSLQTDESCNTRKSRDKGNN